MASVVYSRSTTVHGAVETLTIRDDDTATFHSSHDQYEARKAHIEFSSLEELLEKAYQPFAETWIGNSGFLQYYLSLQVFAHPSYGELQYFIRLKSRELRNSNLQRLLDSIITEHGYVSIPIYEEGSDCLTAIVKRSGKVILKAWDGCQVVDTQEFISIDELVEKERELSPEQVRKLILGYQKVNGWLPDRLSSPPY